VFLRSNLRVFALEDDGQFSDGFLLSLGPQVRMELMVGGDLGDSLGFFKSFQDDLGLESSRILFSCVINVAHGRWCPPYFSPFYCPNLWDHYTLSGSRVQPETAAFEPGLLTTRGVRASLQKSLHTEPRQEPDHHTLTLCLKLCVSSEGSSPKPSSTSAP